MKYITFDFQDYKIGDRVKTPCGKIGVVIHPVRSGVKSLLMSKGVIVSYLERWPLGMKPSLINDDYDAALRCWAEKHIREGMYAIMLKGEVGLVGQGARVKILNFFALAGQVVTVQDQALRPSNSGIFRVPINSIQLETPESAPKLIDDDSLQSCSHQSPECRDEHVKHVLAQMGRDPKNVHLDISNSLSIYADRVVESLVAEGRRKDKQIALLESRQNLWNI